MKSSEEGSLIFFLLKMRTLFLLLKSLFPLFCQFACSHSILKSTSYTSVKNVTEDFQEDRGRQREGRIGRNKKLFSPEFHDHFLSASFDFSSLHPCKVPVQARTDVATSRAHPLTPRSHCFFSLVHV